MTDEMYKFKRSLYDNFEKPDTNLMKPVLSNFVKDDTCLFCILEFGLWFRMSWNLFCIKIQYLYMKLENNGYLTLDEFLCEFGLALGKGCSCYEGFEDLYGFASNDVIGKAIGIDLSTPKKEFTFSLKDVFK